MKKLKLIAVFIFIVSASAFAQPKAYLNGFAGYTFDESFTVQTFQGRFNSNVHYGGSAEFVLENLSTAHSERTIELSYQGMQTVLDGWSWPLGQLQPSPSTFNVNVQYVMAGFNNYFGQSHKAMGFGGLNLGVGWMTNQTESSRPSPSRFAIGLKGGGRFMFTEKVGLKLYAQLNTIVEGVGGGFYFGTGGSGAVVTAFASVVQFGLGGGLTVALGDKPKPATNTKSNSQWR